MTAIICKSIDSIITLTLNKEVGRNVRGSIVFIAALIAMSIPLPLDVDVTLQL
jgi:hypothetical protein